MTREEAIKIFNTVLCLGKCDCPKDEIEECLKMAIKALEQQPSEEEKVIRIKKGTLKVRTGRYVIYDVEWLKEHFNTTEAKIYGQPNEDCISRKAVLDGLASIAKARAKSDIQKSLMGRVMFFTEHLPSVTPQPSEHTEERTETHECDKVGHWIEPQQDDGMSDPIYYQVRCSECNFDLDPQTWAQELHQYGADKYCPRCGCRMQEVKK